MVLADRNFDISDDITLDGTSLVIRFFTRGKHELSLQNVEYAQRIAKVCLNVEQVIGLLKPSILFFKAHFPFHF